MLAKVRACPFGDKVHHRNRVACRAEQQPAEPSGSGGGNKLAAIVKRKQTLISAQLEELGMEGLEERLSSATSSPSPDPYRLARLIAEVVPTGRPVLAYEIGRSPDLTTPQALAEQASALAEAGADALVVPTDEADTPEALSDLFAVSRAAPKLPILRRDWFLHPLQIVEAKESGCAGIIGVVASITGDRGTPVLSSFAAALGLDCPVEVVNLKEMKAMEPMGVPFYGLNLSVGLSIAIPGFGADVAAGILGELPFGAITMAGARSIDEARKAKMSGADSILVKKELVQGWIGRERDLVEALKEATCGDD